MRFDAPLSRGTCVAGASDARLCRRGGRRGAEECELLFAELRLEDGNLDGVAHAARLPASARGAAATASRGGGLCGGGDSGGGRRVGRGRRVARRGRGQLSQPAVALGVALVARGRLVIVLAEAPLDGHLHLLQPIELGLARARAARHRPPRPR